MMRAILLIGWVLVLTTAGCAGLTTPPETGRAAASPPAGAETAAPTVDAAAKQVRADLPDLGPAPELTNEVWINADAPLRLADLRGKVVLLDMWTFG